MTQLLYFEKTLPPVSSGDRMKHTGAIVANACTRLRRYLRDEVRVRVGQALSDTGLVEELDIAETFNEHCYMHSQWIYQLSYSVTAGLRPDLQALNSFEPRNFMARHRPKDKSDISPAN